MVRYPGPVGNTVHEWYGFPAQDSSEAARISAANQSCPIIGARCKKVASGGVCSVENAARREPVIICPHRLYGHGHRFLRQIASQILDLSLMDMGPDGLPTIVPALAASSAAARHGLVQVGVFGQGFGSEIKLPGTDAGLGEYSVDFVLVFVDASGELLEFVPIEVQTIDISGSNSLSVTGLLDGRRRIVAPKAGLNWENVNKRILPQLIVKGLMLQGERLCSKGLYFVSPLPVYQRVFMRLGGAHRLRELPRQPGSITFVPYGFEEATAQPGAPLALAALPQRTVSVSDLSLAFITPENLPPSGSFEERLIRRLARPVG